jgi:tetratricopeptide (TPR) repeat protein
VLRRILIRHAHTVLDADAIALAKRLDGLPLALATAGAFLRQTAMTFGAYLRNYQDSWADLQKNTPQLDAYERTLYSTWQISLEQVRARDPAAAEILRLWAYFGNEDLWLELLQVAEDEVPSWLHDMTRSEISFHATMGVLCDYGLVQPGTPDSSYGSPGYGIHACVHAWTIHVLNPELDTASLNLSIRCIGSSVPDRDTSDGWIAYRRLVNHAVRCAEYAESVSVSLIYALSDIARLLNDMGQLSQAERMCDQALRGKEKVLGRDHTSTLDTVNELGLLYISQGKLDQAERMYDRALRGYEKVLSPDHTSALRTVNNLGLLYKAQGKLDQAERMYDRALRGYEKVIGSPGVETYPPALNTMLNLGFLYRQIRQDTESMILLTRALDGFTSVLGASHSEVLEIRRTIFSKSEVEVEADTEPSSGSAKQGRKRKRAMEDSSSRSIGRVLNGDDEDDEDLGGT